MRCFFFRFAVTLLVYICLRLTEVLCSVDDDIVRLVRQENGEMFGEEALVASLPMCSTATADGPVECVGIDRATFTEVRCPIPTHASFFQRMYVGVSSDGSGKASRWL